MHSSRAPCEPVAVPAAEHVLPATTEVDQAGILSQTLSSSPNTKFILPARLRSALFNDVVFVGPTAIQLRQFTQQGDLSDVLAELEFGTQILGARVISAPSHIVNVEDAILEHGRDEIRFTIRDQPLDDSQPPQILVLSIATGTLVFAYARQSFDGSVQFIYAKRAILGSRSSAGKYGHHLAIDKSSRALAVASMENSFAILTLKDVDTIKEAIDNWDPRSPSTLKPLYEQRFIPVDGTILRMDFLVPPKAEPKGVIILLLIANAGVTRILAYRWDSSRSLATIKPLRSSGEPLRRQDSFPYLLIPSSTEASFSLVTKTEVVFYQDITASPVHRKYAPLYAPPMPLEKDRDKVWVQWARPLRHDAYRAANEEVWLFREDGLMRSFTTGLHPHNRTPTQFDVDVRVPVDGALCALTAPPTVGGDVLIICGDMAAGGVYHIMARAEPIPLQKIPNMSPMHDTIVADERPVAHRRSKRYSILATTGRRDMNGSLAELRYGHEAQIRLKFMYDAAETITNVWSAEEMNGERLLIIASHHEHTTITCYDGPTRDPVLMDESNLAGFDFDCQTLAASQVTPNHILQISRQGLSIASLSPNDGSFVIPTELRCTTVCAYIEPSASSFVLVKRSAPEHHELVVCQVQSVHGCKQIAQIVLDCVPLFVTYASLGTRAICVCASTEQKVHSYILEADGNTYPLLPIPCHAPTEDPGTLSLSGLGVLAATDDRILLICGFKSGEAWYQELEIQGNGSDTKLCLRDSRMDRIGQTAVTVNIGHDGKEVASPQAYIACEGVARTVKMFPQTGTFDYQVDDVWLVDDSERTFSPVTISSINAVPRSVARHAGQAGTLLLFATNTGVLLTEFSAPKLVPRTIGEISGPRQMVWSAPLKRLITVANGASRIAERWPMGSDESVSSLQVIDPAPRDPEANETARPEFRLNSGETVKCLLSWAPTDGERHFDVIVIGANAAGTGRLLYMSARKIAEEATDTKARTIATYPGKQIQAICAFGLSTLAVAVGREVKLVCLDVGSKRWTQVMSCDLPSAATSIASKGSLIYVGTSMHAFMLLREEGGKLIRTSLVERAGKARNIVPYGSGSVIANLITGTGSRIFGFADMPFQGPLPAFEARVPQALDRLMLLKSSVPDHKRHRFIGTSIDGTVQLFTTLSRDEVTLLKFLESLCQPRPTHTNREAKALGQRVAKSSSSRLERAGRVPPGSEANHARGDMLKLLLEPGPYNLHYMLLREVKEEGSSMKVEDDRSQRLEQLARPVVGGGEHLVSSVVAWLRRLLNVPSLS